MEENAVKSLGHNVVGMATWRTVEHNGNRISHGVTIIQGSGVDDGTYSPASDVLIWGAENIRALRDLCNEVLGENKNATPAAN